MNHDELIDDLRSWAYGGRKLQERETRDLLERFAEEVLGELRRIRESQRRIEDHLGIKQPEPVIFPLFTLLDPLSQG